MRAWTVLLLAAALGGCVAQRMAAEVGHPVSEITRRFGPPAKVEYITETAALYIWTVRQDLKRGPGALATFQPIAEFAKTQQQYDRKTVCEFHVIARRRYPTDVWTVDRVLDPRIGCS